MHTSSDENSEDTVDERIRHHAYMLWVAEGRPEGRADEFWHKAANAIAAEDDHADGAEQAEVKPAGPAAAG